METALEDPRLMVADHGIVLGSWQQFLVLVYTGATSLESMKLLHEGYTRFREQSPGPSGLYTVVEEKAPLPPGPVRDEIARFMKSGADHLRASALVQEGTGFRAAAVRSVATGVSLLAKQPFPHQVFSSMTDASAWLVKSFPHVSAQELSERVTAIRRSAS